MSFGSIMRRSRGGFARDDEDDPGWPGVDRRPLWQDALIAVLPVVVAGVVEEYIRSRKDPDPPSPCPVCCSCEAAEED